MEIPIKARSRCHKDHHKLIWSAADSHNIKILRLRKKWPPFCRWHFQMHFLETCILIQISLKFIPECPTDNESALVQVMAWCRTGDKPLPLPVQRYIHIYIYGNATVSVHIFYIRDHRYFCESIHYLPTFTSPFMCRSNNKLSYKALRDRLRQYIQNINSEWDRAIEVWRLSSWLSTRDLSSNVRNNMSMSTMNCVHDHHSRNHFVCIWAQLMRDDVTL